jgi:thiamine-monophosphate kinase
MAEASGARLTIDLARIPLSAELITAVGDGREARLAAATAGDDYELLFSAPDVATQDLFALAEELSLPITPIGEVSEGEGLALRDGDDLLPLPASLGWEHL